MKALIISGRNVQDEELIYPLYRLDEAGWDVTIAADEPEFRGFQGVKFKSGARIKDEAEEDLEYELLVIPGGVKCMEHLRLNKAAISIIERFRARPHGVIAAICSGPLLLVAAGLVTGKKIASYPAWRIDIENAGGEFVEAPAVVDDRIVTSPHYRHVGPWMQATLTAVLYPGGFFH